MGCRATPLRRLARSAAVGGTLAAGKDGCAAGACNGGRCWSADKRDWRVGPSRDEIIFATLELGSVGNGAWGIGAAGRVGTANAGLAGKGFGTGGAPRCIACA